MAMVTAWEKLHAATTVLVGSGNIKVRLVEAYHRHLADIEPAQLPKDLRDAFSDLLADLTHVPPLRGEDAVTATVRKMSNQEADACAARITALLDAVHRWHLAPPRPALEVVPAYDELVSRA